MKRELVEPMLADYSPISLREMDDVRLMNRIDTKYVTSLSVLPKVLNSLKSDYYMQEINGSRLNNYRTLYLDTADRAMYLAHHNCRRSREKVRIRAYADTQSFFLEVKDKNNKGQTKKKRIELPDVMAYRQEEGKKFIKLNAKYRPDTLLPSLENNFQRITLVNFLKTERLTIDLNLKFRSPTQEGIEKSMDNLVIIELKQQRYAPSLAKKILSKLRIYPVSISKYCIGTVLTVTDVKNNMFKKKINQINKIKDRQYEFF